MTDIILNQGEASPNDIRLNDPIPATRRGIPIDAGVAPPRTQRVYYQALVLPIYLAAASLAAQPGWQAPLSVAPPVAKAQAGFAFVPFDTAQRSVNFTPIGWQPQPPSAPPVAQAQVGYSSVPFNTAQLSVNFTNFGWQGPTWTAPPVARAQPGYASVPYNTAQLSVNFTPLGWHAPLAGAPPVARAQAGSSFVPFNTAQSVAVAAYTGIPLQMGAAPPRLRSVYYQTKVEPPYVTPLTPIPLDMGGVLPQLRVLYVQAHVIPPFNTVQPRPDNTIDIGKWQQPLSVAAPVAKAKPGEAFVPFNTVQPVAAIGIPFDMGGAPPRLRQIYYQARFEAPYVAPVVATPAVYGWWNPLSTAPPAAKAQVGFSFVPFNTAQAQPAGIAGMAWHSPLGIVPYSIAYRPQQYPFNPPRFGEIAPSPPAETGTILMPGKAGGGAFTRKKWREILEEEAAQRRAILEQQKALRDEAARVKAIAQEARAAKIAAKADATADKARLDAVVSASETAKQFVEQSAKEEAEFLAAMLAEIANQEDEDDAIMLLVGF